MAWYSYLLQNFPQFIVIHTVKGFGIVNKAEIYVFLELSCFFDNTEDVGYLISGLSAFSKSSLNIWKFMVRVLLKPGLEFFEHYFTSVWDEWDCTVIWVFFGIQIPQILQLYFFLLLHRDNSTMVCLHIISFSNFSWSKSYPIYFSTLFSNLTCLSVLQLCP